MKTKNACAVREGLLRGSCLDVDSSTIEGLDGCRVHRQANYPRPRFKTPATSWHMHCMQRTRRRSNTRTAAEPEMP